MAERQQLVSWTSRWSKDPRVGVMGFLKKKWLKLLSKRKSKVNVVSIMSLVLIVQFGHNSVLNSVRVFTLFPFSISSHFATVHTPVLVMVGSVEHSSCSRAMSKLTGAEQWPHWTPFLNFTHFAAILISGPSSPQLQVTREEEQTPRPETPQGS